MNRNNIYTVNPLYNGSTTQATGDDSVQSGGTTIIYQQGGGTGLTDAQKQKLDGIQEGAEVNQNAYSKVRLNGSDALIIEAKNKTDILNMSGVYPIAIAINGNGGLDFTVSSDQSNTNSVVTQSQLKAAIDQLEKDKYWKVDADGKLYTELDVYSHKEISAYGAGTGGGSTGGAGALYECADVLRDGDKVKGAEVGSVLSYNGTHWYAIPQSAIVPDLSGYATKSYVSQEINDLIGGAPGTLDTLKEIAEALGNNPNFATTVTEMINNIGLRVDQVEDRVVSLEDMFEWDKSASASDPSLWRIKAKKDLYGVGEISAYGYSSGTVPTGAQYMYELKDVLFTELTSGQLLQWNGTKWININKNAVGLNETELAKYLTNNNYAKKSDITWANLLNKPTTWGWASITGKPTTLAGYGITDGVPNTRRVSAGSGLSGGGVLSSNITISLGTIGTAGTYTKITTDMYGRVVSGTTLSEGDIPTLQISKISGLQSALNSKLNISDFNTWFTIKKDSQGRIVSIQANYDFFSVGEISAYGYSSGTVPTGAQYMYELKDVLFTELTSGQLLQWNGTKWININKNAVGLNETELAKYLTNNNYAKKSDITWANLLNKPTTWGWASITGKPTTLAGYGITDGVPNTRRVSAGSGLSGGGVLSSNITISLGTIGTAGTYTKITTDMYGRVVSGTTLSEGDIPTLQISKISGLQSALNSKLNISDFNTWFTIKKDSQGRIVSIQANYDFFSVGEISAYGLGETQPSVTTLAGLDDVTITSPANGQTLIYDSATSQWKNGTIIGGGNISLNGTVYKPVNGTITLPNLATPGDITTALSGYATQAWVTDKNYATQSWVNGKGYVTATALATMGFATQAWVNSQGFLKSNSLDNYVTLNTIQNITAAKTFQAGIVSTAFRKSGGTSSQFLKADGSVDSNVYLTQSSTDTRYVLKTGDTMTGNLIINSVNGNVLIGNYNSWNGSNYPTIQSAISDKYIMIPFPHINRFAKTWGDTNSIVRMEGPSLSYYDLMIRDNGFNISYNNNYNNPLLNVSSDGKAQIKQLLMVNYSGGASGYYNEGIRICRASNGWSNIQFGTNGGWEGKIDGQWVVGKNPANYFQVCMAGTETANTTRPSKGFSVDTNGYLHTSYISTEVNPDNQGDYFYSSDDTFLRRSTWYAALSHLSNKQRTLDLTSLDQNKWYPCIIGTSSHGGTPLRITLFNGLRGNKPTWGSHQQGFSLLLDYEVTGSGWGTLAAIAKLNWYFGSYGGETAFGGRQQNTMASTEIIYLRGGGIYYYRTTNGQELTVQPNGYTWSSSPYNYSAPVKTSQDNSPMDKTFDQVYWAPNNLRNTRTIWGQSFNGTQNVSGALSGATTITATGDITTSANIGGRSINAGADLTVAGYTYCNGRLYVDRGRFSTTAAPAISLAIGDTDTGFHWESDGIVSIYCNAAARGGWQVGQFRYGHGYLKEATGNDYHTLGIMVNGNGTANSIKPGIGFHQPGVYANSLRSDGPGDFKFCVQGGSVGCQVQAGSFYANGGLIYSNANGCQAAFGSQNVSYVHITNNANRAYYMDHTLHISGDVAPYTNEANALGNSSKWWGRIYGKEVYVSGWVRFTGASGVYWTAYSGGWTMNDATYIRSYGGKSLWIEGSIIANGEVTAYSDIRLKTNIKPLDYKGRLAPKWFIKDNKPSIGFIAQEVQALYPELVKVNTSTIENYLSLNYGAITAVLSAQVNKVEDEVEVLKNRIRQLENEVALLKQKP